MQVGDTADNETAITAVKAAVARFGGLHILINNAGIASEGDMMQTSEEDFERVMAVNVTGSSVSGLGGDWEMFAYNTSKGAVSNMVCAELVAKFKERMPLGTPEDPEGIAAAMAFLASDDARASTCRWTPACALPTASRANKHPAAQAKSRAEIDLDII